MLADPSLNRSDLPPWISREEIYDTTQDERWRQLVRVLEGPGETRRAPWMPGDPPEGFVPRPDEFEALKAAVFTVSAEKGAAPTIALCGAGGFGKTTLANFLCRDDDVRFEFTDGILRVEVGRERVDVTGLVVDLIEKLDPGGKRPGFQDVATASEHLGELIGESRILLVIDDVWREAHLRPFLRGGPNCVRLATTRMPQVLPASHVPIAIDEMRAAEALSLLSANLPGADRPAVRVRLAALAKRLGNWAQMLAIANRWLHNQLSFHATLDKAVTDFEERLAMGGLTDFDPEDEMQRDRAIRVCVEASLSSLNSDQLNRFGELAILPQGEAVPFAIVSALWRETGGITEGPARKLVERLAGLSLLQNLDLGAQTLRLHDNMIRYLRDRLGPDGRCAAHSALVQVIRADCNGAWERLPRGNHYGWRHLISHLRKAGKEGEADRLLTAYAWIKAKLRASGAQGLFESYLPESQAECVRVLGRAIALSLPALAANPSELPRQMFGRLGGRQDPETATIITSAKEDADFQPAPRWPGLTPPGAEQLRVVVDEYEVASAAFSPDGTRIVTASIGGTARVWNARNGEEIVKFRGHEHELNSVAFSPDGTLIISTSDDGTARVWDAASSEEIATLYHDVSDDRSSAAYGPHIGRSIMIYQHPTEHSYDPNTGEDRPEMISYQSWVQGAVFSPDGTRIVTASPDRTARVWDASNWEDTATLRGHKGSVQNATFSPNSAQIVTASSDRTARIWDAQSGEGIVTLHGHEGAVLSAAFSPEGLYVVTTSDDKTARIWDASSGKEIARLGNHSDSVRSAAFSADGARIVTASDDKTARIWDARKWEEIAVLRGHEGEVLGVAFSTDGARIVTASADGTARIWDSGGVREIAVPRGHESEVSSVVFSPDGTRIISTSDDGTARVWDARSGEEIAIFRCHESKALLTAFFADVARVVTTSSDNTARILNASSSEQITVLSGHQDSVLAAGFFPDCRRVVPASADKTARIWDAASGEEITVLIGHQDSVLTAAFSPDGTRIVTTSNDETARIWDSSSGEEITVFSGRRDLGLTAGFSPDGTRTVFVSGIARIWDSSSGEETAILHTHDSSVASAAFSPDGARVVTTSYINDARVWDTRSGKEIAILGERKKSNAAFFLDEGRIITAGGHERTAHIWDASSGQEISKFALDAAVSAHAIYSNSIVLGDKLGRLHVFDVGKFSGVFSLSGLSRDRGDQAAFANCGHGGGIGLNTRPSPAPNMPL